MGNAPVEHLGILSRGSAPKGEFIGREVLPLTQQEGLKLQVSDIYLSFLAVYCPLGSSIFVDSPEGKGCTRIPENTQ